MGVFFVKENTCLEFWYFFSLNTHFGHIIYNITIEFRYRNQMFIKLSFTAEFKRERANDDDACPFHQFVRTTNLLWGLLSNSSCYCTFITSFSAKRGHKGLKSFSNVDSNKCTGWKRVLRAEFFVTTWKKGFYYIEINKQGEQKLKNQ